MKIKTSELEGTVLDYAVAVCESMIAEDLQGKFIWWNRTQFNLSIIGDEYSPSSSWLQAGPIIEREKRDIKWSDRLGKWLGVVHIGIVPYTFDGDTMLQAAMRCYVASRCGDTVEVPDELI